MGLLNNVASSITKATSRKISDIKQSVREQQEAFASQRATEEAKLPVIALLKFIDHDFRTWRGFDLDLVLIGGKTLYRGQADYFDFDQLEKMRNEGYIADLDGNELARITAHKNSENSPETYSFSISGMPSQTLKDVTKRMVSKTSEEMRYTFKSLEPTGWVFCRDTKESALAMGHGEVPQGIWRVGYGENITARIERPDSRIPHAGSCMVIRCREEKHLLLLALVAISLTGVIDHR